VNGESEERRMWLMCFINLHEKRTMKPAEITLSRGERGMRKNDGGGEPNQPTL
jgi:hypothetical protein